MTFCTSCGTPASDGPFCTECGARLVVPQPVEANEPTSVLPAQPPVPAPVEPPPAYLPPAPVAPPAYQPPVPVQQPSGGGGRTALIVALVVLLLVGGGIGGVVLWKQQDDDSGTSTTISRDTSDKPSTEPSDSSDDTSEEPEPSPVADPEDQAQCPDGSVVPAGTNCRVNTAAAAMAAFGIDPSRCTASTAGSGHVGAVNLSCLDDQVHVAIYENPQKRLQRLRDYGYESGGCTSEPGGIVLCGPTKNGRWVRTYANGTGILLYASVEAAGYPVLSDLDQLTATELLKGAPVS